MMKKLCFLLIFIFTLGFSSTENNQKLKKALETGNCDLIDFRVAEEDLEGFNEKELIIINNMPVAKYGKIFMTPWIGAYFKKYKWYKAKYESIEGKLQDFELENINTITAYINKLNQYFNQSNFVGEYTKNFFHSGGAKAGKLSISSKYQLKDDGTFNQVIIDASLDMKDKIGNEESGTWKLEDKKIVIQYEKSCQAKCTEWKRINKEGEKESTICTKQAKKSCAAFKLKKILFNEDELFLIAKNGQIAKSTYDKSTLAEYRFAELKKN